MIVFIVGLGGMEVWVGGTGVAVGSTDVSVGKISDDGLHPNSSKKATPIPKAFLNRILRFIWTSSFYQLLPDGKRVN